MVSAFAARQRLVLGQVKVADKANEILAIPKLLDMLARCQRAIAQKILDKKADYIFALKGNQGTLCDDVELFAAEQKACNFKDTTVSRTSTVDGDHGRIETRDIPLSTISTGFKRAINGLTSTALSWSRAPARLVARSNARRVFT